jgi:NADH-quinone oxidoreductase subunit G
MLAKPRKGYILLNVDPDKDTANSAQAIEAMKQAAFVVALSMYRDSVLEEHADVILPMSAFTESAGTYVNTAGFWQSVTGISQPFASSRPAWKILRVLGNFMHLDGFDYESAEAIKHEVKAQIENAAPLIPAAITESEARPADKKTLSRIGEIPLYAVDSLTRHALPLQAAQTVTEGEVAVARLHPQTAASLDLSAGSLAQIDQKGHKANLPVALDARVPVGAVWVAGGLDVTASLGHLFGELTISKVPHVS